MFPRAIDELYYYHIVVKIERFIYKLPFLKAIVRN